MLRLLLTFFSFVLITTAVFAQQDVPNSKDHPLLSRFKGSWIYKYNVRQFETYTYPSSSELVDYNKLKEPESIDGEYTFIEYASPEGVTATQIYRTYETQLTKAGFKIVFNCRTSECGDMPMHFVREYVDGSTALGNSMVGDRGSFMVATGSYENDPYYVVIVVGEDRRNNNSRYLLNIIRQEKLDTDKVDVTSVTDKLETEGRFAFYGIQFDLNSAELKPESTEALQLMADYLVQSPDSEVLIVGHTDNSGNFELNMELSQKRADAVVKRLIADYAIDAKRLTSVGVGMAAPLASNATEEGREKNRRVEMVLK